MDFPSYDIFQDESQAEEEDVERLAVKQREAYRVKSCSPQLDPAALVSSSDCVSLKFAGDLSYSQKDFSQATRFYEQFLRSTTSESGGLVRDVLESLARSYLAAGDLGSAQSACSRLQKVGHLQNVLLLRVQLARRTGDCSDQPGDCSDQVGACLCNLLDLHPNCDRLWLELAEWFRARGSPSQQFWCLEKASSCEKSDNIPDVTQLKENCKLEAELKSRISSRLRNESRSKPNDVVVSEDFVDLGSSIKTKEREEDLSNVKLDIGDDIKTIKLFESRWFN